MSIAFLCGLLSLQGFGVTHSHLPAVAAVLQIERVNIYAEWAPTAKLDTDDGHSIRVRPSFRAISDSGGWYAQLGVEWKRQATSVYVKDGFSMLARAGYAQKWGGHWDVYGLALIPVGTFPRYAVGGGWELHYHGFVTTTEATVGPMPDDGQEAVRQIRLLTTYGWRF